LILLAVIALVLVRQKFMRPIVHPITLHLPVIKTFLHDVNRARFCRSVGTLLESGVPIQEALEITGQALSNHVYAKSVRQMHKHIDTGHNFSEIMGEYPYLYPKLIQRMVAVGEQSGGLGEMLQYLAVYYEGKVENQARNLSSVLEPVLLLVIGLVVAFVAMAILSPIYSITSSLKI
jgi:type II secretory pathway component PulF